MERQRWLAGGSGGLFGALEDQDWVRLGPYPSRITCIARRTERLVVGAGGGAWEVPATGPWRQLHDETLTEVLDIALLPDTDDLVAASAYGLAVGSPDQWGVLRWRNCSAELRVNERFSNAVLVDPADAQRWLVGSEAGVLVFEHSGTQWRRTSLIGVPCRALLHAHGTFWAATDGLGIWRSASGVEWERAGCGLDQATVFSLAVAGDTLVAGTLDGIAVGDGCGVWHRRGVRMLAAAVAVDPQDPRHWLAGGTPGGVWRTGDGGECWQQLKGSPNNTECLASPFA